MRKRKKIEIQNTQRPISDMLKYWIRRSVLHFFGRNGGNISTYFGNFSVSQKTELSRNRDKKFSRVFAIIALVATIIIILSNGNTHDGVLSLIILMIAIALILLPFSTRFFAVLSFFNGIQSDLRLLGNADLTTIDAMSGREFETYCGILYESIGYKVEVTQQSQDQGADIVLVGHNGRTVIQTKRQSTPVGNWAVQEICAAKGFYKADQAVVLTNNTYTNHAKELALANGVELIDRSGLAMLIRRSKNGIGRNNTFST